MHPNCIAICLEYFIRLAVFGVALLYDSTKWPFSISQLLMDVFMNHQLPKTKFHNHIKKFALKSWIKASKDILLSSLPDKIRHMLHTKLVLQIHTPPLWIHSTRPMPVPYSLHVTIRRNYFSVNFLFLPLDFNNLIISCTSVHFFHCSSHFVEISHMHAHYIKIDLTVSRRIA